MGYFRFKGYYNNIISYEIQAKGYYNNKMSNEIQALLKILHFIGQRYIIYL